MHGVLMLALGLVAPVEASVRSRDGVEIRYHAEGRGEPAVVLVHCWTGDRRDWSAQLPRLVREKQVVALDLAGHGESGGRRERWSIEAFADDVIAVVDALALRRFVLVGHSMGGQITLAAALKLRDRVVGLIPVDTLQDVEEKMSPEQIDEFLAPFDKDYAMQAEGFVRNYHFAPGSPPAVIEKVVARARAAPKGMAIAAIRAAWSYDAAQGFDAVEAPIHAINGERFPTNLEANRRHAPQYQLTLIPGVGHYPMLEAPERFGDLLEATLRAVLAAAPRR
ncbi:MAG TPA: alpha/beta hydrolase [Solirubrobacterales bacterium]|nr:alpha/beta hydrolase [Solirubrobacterales bacterium]